MMPRIKKYTLSSFKRRGFEIHGNKFDYSKVEEHHINGVYSYVSIKCNTCDYEWLVRIHGHINGKAGCPDCTGHLPWTLPRFIIRAGKIHNGKYDYSQINDNHFVGGVNNHIPIRCKLCDYEWMPSINNHINAKSGCPDCAGVAHFTLDRFISKATKIHGDRYDYSRITENHVKTMGSYLPIKCKFCLYEWITNSLCHINAASGCPDCARVAPLTLDRFIAKGKNIHGNKYDYSQITEDHIKHQQCHVPIKCNTCKYEWSPTISRHIYGKYGCPKCAGLAPITLESLIENTSKIHGDKYDYSLVTEDHIKGNTSHIPVICRACQKTWFPDISSHINHKSGCPRCCFSSGYSRMAIEWLKSIEEQNNINIQCAISPNGEFKIPSPNGGYYKVDGYHASTNTIYEYYGDYWHGNPIIYEAGNINEKCAKSFGKLYENTIDREIYLKSLGFNLIVKWETPFECCRFLISFNEIVTKLNNGDFLFFKFLPEYQNIPHNQYNYIATFYGKDGNIYLIELQYNQETCQISPPI
jgi:formylmethanofuran dehydrogenase subunit E